MLINGVFDKNFKADQLSFNTKIDLYNPEKCLQEGFVMFKVIYTQSLNCLRFLYESTANEVIDKILWRHNIGKW